ncbi:hypothetical protein JB92DRAFT_3139754 [Gautieria morchelliformis]|nr:hypothetical protein JB92DRAFT_3139754 [Gautieria morchelliformis]
MVPIACDLFYATVRGLVISGLHVDGFYFSDLETSWFNTLHCQDGLLPIPGNFEPPPVSIFLTICQGFLHSLLPPVPVPNEVAVVQPCSTGGRDATSEVTTYTETRVSVVINLCTMECVIGSMKRGGDEWGIVDRSGDFARTVFVDPEIDHD